MSDEMPQLELFEIVGVKSSNLTIDEAFAEFHEKNPHVYRNLRHLALQAVQSGRKKLGIRLLWERLRWEYFVNTDRPLGEFMLNDHYHSRYVRLLVQLNPALEGLFEMRELKSLQGKRRRIIVTSR